MTDPFAIRDQARKRLPRMIFDFVDGGTGAEQAQAENCRAFNQIKLQPRVLRNVETIDLATRLFDRTSGLPLGIAPMGMCNLIAVDADKAMAREAARRDIPLSVSTAASTTMEDSFRDSEERCWFQLYAGSNEAFTFELLDRAENAGYETIIFTVDTPRNSRRPRDLQNGFSVPIKFGVKQVLDFAMHPRWSISMLHSGTPEPMNYKTSKVQTLFERYDSRGASDWIFLKRLRERWKGKLVVKGVTSVENALQIEDIGCNAIYVSNHGGRQLDSTLPAISALPNIAAVLKKETSLIFDSGIRSADDVLRALALGADMVMLGRPVLYALAAGGAAGLATFLDRMESDLKSAMAQVGATSIAEIDHRIIAQKGRMEVER